MAYMPRGPHSKTTGPHAPPLCLTPSDCERKSRRACVCFVYLQHANTSVTLLVFFVAPCPEKTKRNTTEMSLEIKLVNPGFAGGATAESLIRASFSPDGRFVVSGSEKGQVRVWEAQEGKRVRTPLQVCTKHENNRISKARIYVQRTKQ